MNVVMFRIRFMKELVHKLGTEKAAHVWLNTPNKDWNSRCPWDILDTEDRFDLGAYVENHIF